MDFFLINSWDENEWSESWIEALDFLLAPFIPSESVYNKIDFDKLSELWNHVRVDPCAKAWNASKSRRSANCATDSWPKWSNTDLSAEARPTDRCKFHVRQCCWCKWCLGWRVLRKSSNNQRWLWHYFEHTAIGANWQLIHQMFAPNL